MFVAWMAYVAYVGGDALVRFRLLAPLLPLFYALIAASGAAIIRSLQRSDADGSVTPAPPRWRSRTDATTPERAERVTPRAARRPLSLADGAAALAVAGLIAFTLQASSTDVIVGPEGQAVRDRSAIGRWLRERMPEDTTIAVIPAGAIPYESRLVTIDMLGINDEHIAHRDLNLGRFAAGHEKFDSAYVLGRSPDIIILEDTLARGPRTREAYEELAVGLIPARVDMLRAPGLWDAYEARSVEVREDAWFNLLVRSDARDVLAETLSAETAMR
jgi:hypothetical protein